MTAAKPKGSVLARIQADCKNPAKSTTGQIGTREFQYAPLDQILDEVRPIFKTHNVSCRAETAIEEIASTNAPTQVLMVVNTTLEFEGETIARSTYPVGFLPMNDKDIGSSITYGRRYTLLGVLNIQGDEDLDAQGQADKTNKKRSTTKKNNEKRGAAREFVNTHVAALAAFSTPNHVVTWEITNKEAINALRDRHPKLHEELMSAKDAALVRVGNAMEASGNA